jgi:tetratricopeptide (TPR) repeat protein
MAGDAERTKAVGFFKRALELEGRQTKPDHLSGVDYALFLYNWYQPVPVPSQKSKDFVDYMDLAETYLREAETYTPGEPSVYTTLARILTHPPDEVSTEPQPALSESELKAQHASIQSRLLEAELKAKYGLGLDSTSSVANLTMGEVLTDQAAELRNRLLQTSKSDLDDIPDEPTARGKFAKAKKSLEEARAHGADSTSLSDALYARALSGAGDFALAEKVLNEADDDDSHVVEWVWGEMLYNQKRYSEAHAHLTKAQNLRSCGPRSNVVRNLIARIEAQFGKEHSATPERASTNVSKKIPDAAAAAGAERVKASSEIKPACPGWHEPENEEPSP